MFYNLFTWLSDIMVKKVGQYELKTILGRGTFGTVYLGRHTPSNMKIAIKVISKDSLKPELQLRLEQEIHCQRSVSSEYIVKLIDVQKTENNFYLILEYCEGGDLGTFIRKKGPVTEEIAQKWIREIVEGFKALYNKNIIHRDLKLQNILMTENSAQASLKLADFGLSRFLEDDLAKTWVGTPLYMAPEIFNCQEYNFKADIWSLGLVLYEILTGELPLKVHKREQIPQAQKNMKAYPDNVSPDCKDLLSRLLQYDPNKRISFEDLYNHPFIRGSKKPEVLQNNFSHSESDADEDFILLERDESIHEMTILIKDTHPMVNISEIITSADADLEVFRVLEALGNKYLENKEMLFALAINIQATELAEKKYKEINEVVSKYELKETNFPQLYEKFQSIKDNFTKMYTKCETMSNRMLFDKVVKNSCSIPIYQVLMEYAIELCNNAAKCEYLNTYSICKDKYQEAIILLDYLNRNYDGEEKRKLKSFISETYRRHENVKVKVGLA